MLLQKWHSSILTPTPWTPQKQIIWEISFFFTNLTGCWEMSTVSLMWKSRIWQRSLWRLIKLTDHHLFTSGNKCCQDISFCRSSSDYEALDRKAKDFRAQVVFLVTVSRKSHGWRRNTGIVGIINWLCRRGKVWLLEPWVELPWSYVQTAAL